MTIICYPNPTPTADTNVYSMYLGYKRDPLITDPISGVPTFRQLTIPTGSYRYYINNLGMGRAWMFLMVEKSKLQIRYENLELDVQQGSH